jgi:hypothetical protein
MQLVLSDIIILMLNVNIYFEGSFQEDGIEKCFKQKKTQPLVIPSNSNFAPVKFPIPNIERHGIIYYTLRHFLRVYPLGFFWLLNHHLLL